MAEGELFSFHFFCVCFLYFIFFFFLFWQFGLRKYGPGCFVVEKTMADMHPALKLLGSMCLVRFARGDLICSIVWIIRLATACLMQRMCAFLQSWTEWRLSQPKPEPGQTKLKTAQLAREIAAAYEGVGHIYAPHAGKTYVATMSCKEPEKFFWHS